MVAPSPSSFRNNNLSEDIKKLYLQINKERERERTCSELVGVREGVGLVAELSELEAEGGEGGGGELDGTLAIFFYFNFRDKEGRRRPMCREVFAVSTSLIAVGPHSLT